MPEPYLSPEYYEVRCPQCQTPFGPSDTFCQVCAARDRERKARASRTLRTTIAVLAVVVLLVAAGVFLRNRFFSQPSAEAKAEILLDSARNRIAYVRKITRDTGLRRAENLLSQAEDRFSSHDWTEAHRVAVRARDTADSVFAKLGQELVQQDSFYLSEQGKIARSSSFDPRNTNYLKAQEHHARFVDLRSDSFPEARTEIRLARECMSRVKPGSGPGPPQTGSKAPRTPNPGPTKKPTPPQPPPRQDTIPSAEPPPPGWESLFKSK